MSLLIGKKIKRLRDSRKWSLRELESRTHINYSVLSRIESGKRPVVDAEIMIFAKVFSVSPNELLGYSDSVFEEKSTVYEKLGISEEIYKGFDAYQHEVLDWAVTQENFHFKNQSDDIEDMIERLEIAYEVDKAIRKRKRK